MAAFHTVNEATRLLAIESSRDVMPTVVVQRAVGTDADLLTFEPKFPSPVFFLASSPAKTQAVTAPAILVHDAVPKPVMVHSLDPGGDGDAIRVERVAVGDDNPVGEVGQAEMKGAAEFSLGNPLGAEDAPVIAGATFVMRHAVLAGFVKRQI